MNLERFVQDGKQKVVEALSPEEIDIVNKAISANCMPRCSNPNILNRPRCQKKLLNNQLPYCYKESPIRMRALADRMKVNAPSEDVQRIISFLQTLGTMDSGRPITPVKAPPTRTLREIVEEARCR